MPPVSVHRIHRRVRPDVRVRPGREHDIVPRSAVGEAEPRGYFPTSDDGRRRQHLPVDKWMLPHAGGDPPDGTERRRQHGHRLHAGVRVAARLYNPDVDRLDNGVDRAEPLHRDLPAVPGSAAVYFEQGSHAGRDRGRRHGYIQHPAVSGTPHRARDRSRCRDERVAHVHDGERDPDETELALQLYIREPPVLSVCVPRSAGHTDLPQHQPRARALRDPPPPTAAPPTAGLGQ